MDLEEAARRAESFRRQAKWHPGHGFAAGYKQAAETIEKLIGGIKVLRAELEAE